MRNYIVILLSLVFVLSFADAKGAPETRQLRGRIVTQASGDPMPGVQVVLEQGGASVVSDQNGRWMLSVPDGKRQIIAVSCIGYEPKRVSVNPNQNDIIVRLVQDNTPPRQDLGRLYETHVTLDLQNVSLATLLREIQRQTGLHFVYNASEVERFFGSSQSYRFQNQSVKSVLDRLVANTSVKYSLTNDDVVVLRVEPAQGRSTRVSGRVLDNHRDPIPFATVSVKGTTKGVSTDADGNWELLLDRNDQPTLVFSCIGFDKKEYKLATGAADVVPMTLQPSLVSVDEVVVTGYERVDKRRMTGSVVSVKGEDVIEPTGLTIDKMLQGKLPGVQVTQNSSTPGAAPKIRIRGTSSILGNREPVWVIDGIIMEDPVKITAAELNSMDRVNLIGNAISFLNPEDIDRIDVLKDVSATAIYGVKAANGVVVITTKRGRTGAPSFSYSTNLTVKLRPSYRTANLMNSNERIDVSEEIARRGLLYTGGGVTEPKVAYEGLLSDFWDKKIDYEQFVAGVNVLRRENTDWFDLLMRNSFSQTHNVALSGGSDKCRYYVSASVADDKDAQRYTGTTRYTANANIDMQVTRRLKLTVGLNGATSTGTRTHPSLDLLSYAYTTARTIKSHNEDGSLFYYPLSVFDPGNAGERQYIGYNIFNEIEHSWQEDRAQTANLNVNLVYKFTDWLEFNTVFGYSINHTNTESVADDQSYYITERRKVPYGVPIPEDPTFRSTMDMPYGGELVELSAEQNTYNVRPTLLFNKRVGSKGFMELQGGMELRSSKYHSRNSIEWGYLPDRGKQFVNVDLSEFTQYRKNIEKNHPVLADNINNTMSIFAIARYTWDNRYTANFNVRYDGSNRFGRDRSTRFLPVWSVSGRWNIANEKFLEDADFLDGLGLKASYGAQGNVVDGQTPYMVIKQGMFVPATNQYLSTLNAYPNPKLRWEKTMSWQVGLDFAFFRGRLSGTFEYYNKIGRDQIVTKLLSLSTGVDAVMMNGGSLWNKGWDLGISGTLISSKDVRWTATFNISRNTNRIENTESPGLNSYSSYIDGSVIINGQSVNAFYSYKFDGLDNNGLPTFRGISLLDDNGNPAKTFEQAIGMVMTHSGQRDPKVSGGFTTSINYKKLTLNMSFSYALGNHVRLNKLYKESGQQLPLPQQNWSKEFINRWQNPGDETNIPVLSDQMLSLAQQGDRKFNVAENYWQMYNNSDIRIVKGDYLRCSSMSLNYTFGEGVCKFIHAKSLTVGLTASNLFLIADKRLNGQDPEMVGFGSRTLPPQRSFSFSLNVNF